MVYFNNRYGLYTSALCLLKQKQNETKQSEIINGTIHGFYIHSNLPSRDSESHGWEKQNLKCVHWGLHVSETFIYQVQNYSSVHVMIYDPSSYRSWVSPHINYLQRHNPFFFFFALPPIAVSLSTLSLVLTLLWIAFTDFYFNFTPNKVKPNAYRVIAPISTVT